ncbi:MAG: desulfoferrodoxin [Candidatus Methanofastidiosia archaeon]
MTQKLQIYKCEICGNIVEVLHEGKGELVCCGQPMQLFEEKTEEQGAEKHLPVIEKMDNGIKAKVGSVPHPMVEGHYIEWIEVVAMDRTYRKFLKPGDETLAEFEIRDKIVEVRAYCNVHGLWSTKK